MQQYMEMMGMCVKDKVTGFAGVVQSVNFDLYGCVQFSVVPPVNEKGERVESSWFDSNRFELTDKKRVMPVPSFAAIPEQHDKGPSEKNSIGLR